MFSFCVANTRRRVASLDQIEATKQQHHSSNVLMHPIDEKLHRTRKSTGDRSHHVARVQLFESIVVVGPKQLGIVKFITGGGTRNVLGVVGVHDLVHVPYVRCELGASTSNRSFWKAVSNNSIVSRLNDDSVG